MSLLRGDTANASKIFNQMLEDKNCSIFLTIAGSTSAAGCMIIFRFSEIQYGRCHSSNWRFNYRYGFFEALGFKHYQRVPISNDKELRENYIDRIYDTYMMRKNYKACDKTICDVADTLKPNLTLLENL